MNFKARMLRRWLDKHRVNLSPTQIIAITFAVIILIGAVLLTLPAASRGGSSCS